jgi:hypothetical protein
LPSIGPAPSGRAGKVEFTAARECVIDRMHFRMCVGVCGAVKFTLARGGSTQHGFTSLESMTGLPGVNESTTSGENGVFKRLVRFNIY